MAQTIQQIEAELIAAKNAEPGLAALNSTSATALWRLWIFIQTAAVFTLQKLFDALGVEINLVISNMKPHSARWYAQKCLAFQYGFNLLPDSDQFNNTNYTDQQITASKIIAYAACVESASTVFGSFLRIKVAKLVSGDLAPLAPAEKTAFIAYLQRIKDAGVYLVTDSLPADGLKQTWKVYYNPLVLNSQGARIDGSDPAPVRTAIETYLKNLPFNGEYRPTSHIDAVQKVEGVEDPVLKSSTAQYGNLPYTAFADVYNPDSGYLRFITPTDLVITYEAKT